MKAREGGSREGRGDGGAGARGRGRRGPGTGAAVREARGAPGLRAVYGWTTHCRIGDGWHTDTRGTVLRRMVGPVIGCQVVRSALLRVPRTVPPSHVTPTW